MIVSCKNCGSHFTADEMRLRRPPLHPWKLTPAGQRVALENERAGGDPRPCPVCGCKTLR